MLPLSFRYAFPMLFVSMLVLCLRYAFPAFPMLPSAFPMLRVCFPNAFSPPFLYFCYASLCFGLLAHWFYYAFPLLFPCLPYASPIFIMRFTCFAVLLHRAPYFPMLLRLDENSHTSL